MRSFLAVNGTAPIRSPMPLFVAAFVKRIETGLLGGRPHWRSRYVVTGAGVDRLGFRAVDWVTAFNVGLNDVAVTASGKGEVRYTIVYARWASFSFALSALIGGALIAFLLFFDVRGYILRHRESSFPRLSMDQNLAIVWAIALFCVFIWPWILIALHRRPLRHLMERLIREVDSAALAEKQQ